MVKRVRLMRTSIKVKAECRRMNDEFKKGVLSSVILLPSTFSFCL
jgi:hypothetical protein